MKFPGWKFSKNETQENETEIERARASTIFTISENLICRDY